MTEAQELRKDPGWHQFLNAVVLQSWTRLFRILFWVYLAIVLAFGLGLPGTDRWPYLAPRVAFALLLYVCARAPNSPGRLRLLYLVSALVCGVGNVQSIGLKGPNLLVELTQTGLIVVGLIELDYAWGALLMVLTMALGVVSLTWVKAPLTPLALPVPLIVGALALWLRHHRLRAHYRLLQDSRRLQSRLETALKTVQAYNQSLDQRVQDRSRQLRSASLDLEDAHRRLAASQQQQLELQQQWLQAQRLETLGRLARGLYHEFSNGLTIIRGGLHFARQVAAEGEEQELLDDMERAVERGFGISRRFLLSSGRFPSSDVPVDLNRLVSETLDLLRPRLAPTHVCWQAPASRVWITGDPTQLEQIVMNLVFNAAYVSPPTRPVQVTLRAQGERALLSVSDEGCGIPPDLQGRVFEPFFTTKPLGQGSGLGLAIVLQMTRRHGGACYLESVTGRGSAFTVDLPLAAPPRPPLGPLPPQPTDALRTGRGRSLLLVEDALTLRELLARYLRGLGYGVEVAATAEEALGMEAEIQILVTDIVLPGMDGVRLAQRLRQQQPELRVIFITGYSQEEVKLPEPHPYWLLLSKPFGLPSLASSLQQVCSGLPETSQS